MVRKYVLLVATGQVNKQKSQEIKWRIGTGGPRSACPQIFFKVAKQAKYTLKRILNFIS